MVSVVVNIGVITASHAVCGAAVSQSAGVADLVAGTVLLHGRALGSKIVAVERHRCATTSIPGQLFLAFVLSYHIWNAVDAFEHYVRVSAAAHEILGEDGLIRQIGHRVAGGSLESRARNTGGVAIGVL